MAPPEGSAAAAEPEVKTVTMTDSRIVEFVGKRRVIITEIEDTETGRLGIRADFLNGETRTVFSPDALVKKFTTYGIKSKYGDVTGGLDSAEKQVAAFDALDKRVQAGEWVQRSEEGVSGYSVLVRALVDMYAAQGKPKDIAKVAEWVKGKTMKQKTKLRRDPLVKPFVDALEKDKPEDVQATKNTLAELDAIE